MSKKHKGRTLTIAGKSYPVVYSFSILRSGWASDNVGFVVIDGDKHRVASTNHGTPCFLSSGIVDQLIGDLEEAKAGIETAQRMTLTKPGAA